MSAIAEFITVDNSKIKELRQASIVRKSWFGKKKDNFPAFLVAISVGPCQGFRSNSATLKDAAK